MTKNKTEKIKAKSNYLKKTNTNNKSTLHNCKPKTCIVGRERPS